MRILTTWLREMLPGLQERKIEDRQLAEDLTLRGIAVEGVEVLGDSDGSLFEMDITTNRVDAMNHYGVAREAATIYGLRLAPLDFPLPEPRAAGLLMPVRIEAADACGRFTAQVVRGVSATGSGALTQAMERYFRLLGQKSIAHAVDASNFAWLMMGHPTHAFDLDYIEGAIVVRRARRGEWLKTLDGIERELDPEDLIVADEAKPLGLAGVMGGWETMIRPETRNVLVESAWFDPVAVRRTARRHGLHTDASHRFERGADFCAAPVASALVTALLVETGGWLDGARVDARVEELEARTARRPPVRLALGEVQRILGQTVDTEGILAAAVQTMLGGLGCVLETENEADGREAWQVALPSWRLDLEREIDLIEEVARVYGYNRFANTLPPFVGSVQARPTSAAEAAVCMRLRAAGVHQTIGSTFCSAAEAQLCEPQPGVSVPLGNPLSAEAGMLRPSLVPSMLGMVAGNLHRDVSDVRLFEMGTVFSGSTERVEERLSLAIGLAGAVPTEGVFAGRRELEFFDLKGIVEQVVESFAAGSVAFDQFPPELQIMPEWLHPWRAARLTVDGLTVGWLGELHPRQAAARKLKARVLVAELYLDRLLKLPLRRPAMREISRFQPVRRDFSLLLPRRVSWAAVDRALVEMGIAEMVDWRAREIFHEGVGITADSYALLLGVTFQAQDRTLREDELQGFAAKIVAAAEGLGGRLRGEAVGAVS